MKENGRKWKLKFQEWQKCARVTAVKILAIIWTALIVALSVASAQESTSAKAMENSFSGKVLRITIGQKDLINGQTFKFWERILERVKEEKPVAVVFDLNTPGGLAMATQELMGEIAKLEVPTFSYVNPMALSAGALVAVSTDKIYMAPGSTIGAAAVVNSTGMEIEKHMRAKLESAFDAHVRGILDKQGHRHEVVRAMTVIDDEEDRKVGDLTVKKGELLTLTAEEAVKVQEDGKPLLAIAVVKSLEELLKNEGLSDATIVTATPTGFEKFAWWIAGISPLLIMIGLGGGYLELKSPGFGIGGAVALTAFGLFFFGNYVAGGLAGYELAFVFILGIILIALEIFVIPGFAITGLIGAGLVVVSLVMSMTDSFKWDEAGEIGGVGTFWELLRWPVFNLAIGLVGGTIIMLIMMRFLPNVPFFNRFLLNAHLKSEEVVSRPEVGSLVGQVGETVTDLRPAGKVLIGERRVDVTLDSGYAPKGTKVRVVEQGMSIVVEIVKV